MIIRVHVVVDSNSIPYFEYLINNYNLLSSGKYKLKFVAHTLDLRAFNFIKQKYPLIDVLNVILFRRFIISQSWRDYLKFFLSFFGRELSLKGSNGHASGITSALHKTESNGIDLIADADTVMLLKNWDIFLVDILNKYGIVGTCYEDIGGFSSGSGKVQTYKKLPSMTWFALSGRFDWKNLDPSPKKSSNIEISTNELSDLYNLPIGYELVRDVGWRLPGYLKENNIQAIVFDQIKPTSKKAMALKTKMDYHEEYHINGIPVLAHQRGSHKHEFRKSLISSSFYDACDKYMQRMNLN
jgi:hypothetical protein